MIVEYTPRQKELDSDQFQMNAWMDSVNNPSYLPKWKVYDLVNMDFNDYGPVGRLGLTLHGNSGNSVDNAKGAILVETGDVLVRAFGTKFQKLLAGTWTDVATITSKQAVIVSYQ